MNAAVLVAATFVVAAPPVVYAPVRDCTGPEYRRLDFWVGEWIVSNPQGAREGENRISPSVDGCAVQEDWRDQDGSSGQSLFFYDRAAARWKQVWVTSAGGWKEKTEQPGVVPGAVRFQGEIPKPGGGVILDRTTLTSLPDGRVRQVIEQSDDKGVSWKSWEGLYLRRPRAPTCSNHDFDFWLGTWDLVVRAHPSPSSAQWVEARGTNRIEASYAGCVIEEHFRADGPGEPWSGQSVSAFQNGKWRQTWVDDSGSYLAFIGGWDGKKLELRGEPGEQGGKHFQKRMVFSDIGQDHLHWSWELTEDAGRSWTPQMTIEYRRHRPAARSAAQ